MSGYEIIVIVLMIMGLSEGITTRIKITAKAAIQCGYLNKPFKKLTREFAAWLPLGFNMAQKNTKLNMKYQIY
jgi:ribosome-associated toxin RatA of RatAB toxin-antitoxin module